MKCTNCQAELENGAKFCTACGQPVPEDAAPEAPAVEEATPEATPEAAPAAETAAKVGFLAKVKDLAAKAWGKTKDAAVRGDEKLESKLGDKKMYVYAGLIGLVGLIIVIASIAGIIPNDNGYIAYDSITTLVENDDKVYFVSKGKINEVKTSAEIFNDQQTSIDGKVVLFESEGVLYRLKGKKAVELAEDVKDFQLSLYGDYVIYTVADGTLSTTYYHCKVSNGKSVELFESDLESMLLSYSMSPNGKSVAYVASNGLDDAELYFFNGKKSSEVAECNGKVVGLTDNGKYIYVTDMSESGKCNLYSFNKKGKETKIDSCDLSSNFALNLDATELMYTSNGKTFVSRKAKEPIKAASAEIYLLAPEGTASTYRTPSSTRVYPVDTLFGHVYTSGTNAYLVNKKEDKCIKLVKGSSFKLDASAKYLYYMDKEDLMVLKVSKGESAEDKAKLIAEDVGYYVVTSDRKLVYYADEDLELFAVNGKKGGKAKKISNETLQDAPVLDRNDVLYYACEDSVYATKGKKAGKKLMDDAEYEAIGGYVYLIDEDNTLYAAKGKAKPKKLMTRED